MFLHWLIATLAVYITAYLLPGVEVRDFWSSIIIAAVIGILNAVVKPLLVFFSLPVTILTLGLFMFVIDALVILMASALLDSFEVQNFWWAMAFSVILSIVSQMLNKIIE